MTTKAKRTVPVLVTILWIFASIAYADVWVDPISFDVNTPEGTFLERTLTIGNDGAEVLNFMIRTRQVGPAMSGQGTAYSSIPAGHDFARIAPNASYQQGRLIVRFAQGAYGIERKNQILNLLGGASVVREFQIVPGLCVVELPAGMTVEEALQAYNSTDGILYAEPDYEVKIDSTIPNDSFFNELWGMHNTGQSGGTVDADIDAPEAWDISTGSSNVVVAVIDTGVDYTHQDLSANMWVNTGEIPGNGQDDDGNGYIDDVYGYDFVNNDGNPMDDHYHGTHCAGTIGAVGNNSQGVAGVCWNVKIMAVKFLNSAGSGSTSNAILSVQYSTLMGANLSSNSWGGGGYSQGLKDAIDAAGAAGMLFIAAAGNNSGDNDTYPHYPSSYDSESLIAVMATDRYDNRSSFSNYGPTSVDLGAPGSSILSCEPGNQYQYLNGTSMATPHVAGACALLWSMNPAVSNTEIKNILIQTVDPTLSGQCVSGGRLNLYNAILEIKAPWIIIEPEEGTVGPGDSNEVNVTFDAIELTPGIYEAEIVIVSDAPSSPTVIPVTLTVTADDLQVAPAGDFDSSGTRGGPFTPKCMTYTLTNNGGDPVNWTTSETEVWFQVEPNAGVLGSSDSIEVDVCISADANLLTPDIYEQILTFENTNSGSIKQRLVTLTVKPPDCFTESFGVEGGDLEGLMLTFSPDGTVAYYEACREKVEEFPTDPNGGTYVSLGDDDFAEVILSNDANILFYGIRYDRFYIGSNGYITFGSGDTEFSASLENHFNMPRISAVFTDLTPADSQSISYKQLQDRVAVTYKNVPLYGNKTAKNSFQVEMFYVDGKIRITWLDIASGICVTGLSEGYGLPPQFLESNLSEYVPCWPRGDFNRDYYVNMSDLSIFVLHWLEEDCGVPYWCEKTDLDFSGKTDLADYSIVAGNWLTVEDWWLQPISHWRFDEGSGTIAYDSVGDNDGTLIGDPCWVAGRIDGALSFDGVDDYIDMNTAGAFDFERNNTFTLSVWYKGGSSSSTILSKMDQALDYRGYDIFLNGGYVQAHLINAWSHNAICVDGTLYPVTDLLWHHIAVTYDGSSLANGLKIYVDGMEETTSVSHNSLSSTIRNSVSFKVAARSDSTGAIHHLNGLVDDVRVYDRVLSAEEIWQLYYEGLGPEASNPNPSDGAVGVDPNSVLSWSSGKYAASHDVYLGIDFDDVNDADTGSPEYMGNFDVNTFDVCGLDINTTYYWRIDEANGIDLWKGNVWSFTTWLEPNFVSWWKFDDGSGTIAYDSAGNNDGAIIDASWFNDPCRGMCLDFDGSGDYVRVNDSVSMRSIDGNTAEYTISLWVRTTQSGAARWDEIGIFDRRATDMLSGANFWVAHIYLNEYDATGFFIRDSFNDESLDLKDTLAINDNTWHHIAAVRKGTDYVKVYVDGGLRQSGATTADPYTTEITTIGVRRTNLNLYTGFFDGKIDDVRIYNRALSAEEIEELYREGSGPEASCPNPADGATNVDPNTVLSWSPGKNAASHDVYLGTDFSDVNDADVGSPEYMGNFNVNSWDPCTLDINTTYYWRIDEVKGINLWKGDVWSFKTWLEPNFISWWKFDEGSGTTAYDSAGDNDGMLTGDPCWVAGQINGALSFDGVDDFVDMNTAGAFDFERNDTFTLSVWYKGSSSSSAILSKMDIANQCRGYDIFLNGGYVQAHLINAWSHNAICVDGTLYPVTNSLWHHIAITYDGSSSANGLKIYVDGMEETTSVSHNSLSSTIRNSVSFKVASRSDSAGTINHLDGLVDDVRVYDRVLSAVEIWQLYQQGL